MTEFRPPAWLANRHVQSIFPSFPLRRPAVERRARAVIAASRPLVLECGDGVRLLGWHAEPPPGAAADPPRIAVLLHGWEGSADSLYLLSLAQLLHARGVGVIRLNLRDHGGTHALNRELFHSCRLPEVVGAVARVQALFPAHRLLLAGYSLGGNFCLRVGARGPSAGIRIARIVAVCPVLDPATTLEALERGPSVYRNYFLFKWRRSLQLKQAAWPGDYDFGDMIRDPSLTAMTERMVLKYTDFPDLATYLRGYAITGNVLESLEAPAHLLTSKDDPMILTHDLDAVARPRSLEITITSRGGHCGYMDAFSGPSWIDRRIADELASA
ncbi:MAG TPA: alpha/beta fold hydrolase [Steroidobacteraceae bacterium]|nr:alpha/beta fold hydrolase [Steroidobacteraceae bacterium]